MVEKIIVNPESVRGWGNIVMEHTVEDYSLVGSSILVDSDTVMGVESVVYTIEAEDNTISVALVSSVASCSIGDSVVLSATVLDDEEPVEGGTVTFKLGSTTLGTDETDSDGVATYTYTTTDVGSLNFTALYESHNSNTVSVVVSHDYSIAFDSSSYTTSTGDVTAYVTLLDNSNPVSGASISLTGTGSTVTATTNSSGVATFNLTGISADCTITATYENVSDTATVTVGPSYLFYDDCTSDRSSEYANASIQASNRTNYLPLTYNSNGYYTIQATSNEGNHYAKWITALDGKDNIRFSCEVSTNTFNGTNRFGIIIGDVNDFKSERYHIANKTLEHVKQIGTTTETVIDSHTLSLSANTWYKMEYTVQGTSFTFTISDMNDTVLHTNTGTFDSSVITSSTTKQYGLYYLNYGSSYQKMFRNITAEAL